MTSMDIKVEVTIYTLDIPKVKFIRHTLYILSI